VVVVCLALGASVAEDYFVQAIFGAYVYGDKELYEVTSHMSWATWFFLVMVVAATLYFFFKKR